MFLNLNKQTDLDTFISKAFMRYKEVMIKIHELQRKQEDVYGNSTKQYIAAQYQMAIGLVVLIKLDVNKNLGQDWDYFVDKYNLIDISKRLACVGIDLEGLNDTNFQAISLNNVLTDFELPTVQEDFDDDIDGIGGMEIESSFEIEPSSELETNEIIIMNITELLDTPSGCTSSISSTCN